MPTSSTASPTPKIYETIVKSGADGALVQVGIANAPAPYENAPLQILLSVRVPPCRTLLLTQIEWKAMEMAREVLVQLIDSRFQAIAKIPRVNLLDPFSAPSHNPG